MRLYGLLLIKIWSSWSISRNARRSRKYLESPLSYVAPVASDLEMHIPDHLETQKIPVFVSCLQRIDSILLSTGITLTLSASYLHSALSIPSRDLSLLSIPTSNEPFIIAFPSILLLNLCLNLLHTPLILPRIGVHTTAYVGFLLGLGSFFVGLGLWGALA